MLAACHTAVVLDRLYTQPEYGVIAAGLLTEGGTHADA
jgi:hypothetical protein